MRYCDREICGCRQGSVKVTQGIEPFGGLAKFELFSLLILLNFVGVSWNPAIQADTLAHASIIQLYIMLRRVTKRSSISGLINENVVLTFVISTVFFYVFR